MAGRPGPLPPLKHSERQPSRSLASTPKVKKSLLKAEVVFRLAKRPLEHCNSYTCTLRTRPLVSGVGARSACAVPVRETRIKLSLKLSPPAWGSD